jgi:hypothetical protein
VDIIQTYPIGPLNRTVNRWAADYIRFNNPDQRYSDLFPSFTGDVTAEWGLTLFTDSIPAGFRAEKIPGVSPIWSDTISNFGLSTNAVLAVSPLGRDGLTSYTIRASALTGIDDETSPPHNFKLGPIYPNPFNGNVLVKLSGVSGGTLKIYDISGRLVREIATPTNGEGEVVWDGRSSDGKDAASGVYMFKLSGNGGVRTVRATLLR